jgi:uncharacterized protein (TIGR03437 family)
MAVINPADDSYQWVRSGLTGTDGCSFSPDGKLLFVSADLIESPYSDKIAAIKTDDWSVVQTWATDRNAVPVIQALPNGKAYALTQDLASTTGNLKIVTVGGGVKSIDLGFMPRAIALASNGRTYVQGTRGAMVMDATTDQIVDNWTAGGGLQSLFFAFPSEDPQFCYSNNSPSTIIAWNLAQKQDVTWGFINPGQTYGMLAHRQKDGSDTIVLLRADELDVFQVIQPATLYAVTNGTSSTLEKRVAPGEIVSISGAKLTETAAFGTIPLPTQLAGIRVVMNDNVDIPLYYVSPQQVFAQIPFEVEGESVSIRVISPQGWIYPVTVPLAKTSPVPFLGPKKEVLVNQVGSWTTASAAAGQVATIYATGLGQVSPQVATGSAAPLSPLSYVAGTTSVTLCGQPAEVLFSGLTPTFVGLYQINIRVPPECESAPENLNIEVIPP